ncbi:unnamed protein product [Allacma fusca]|uniref:Uncharacterized protein n=1 Tax=Allacma fusca TaxID=39272 RepID=A0A8J2KJP6_9HEXA|nr:unnamed protein product [Allacma fusca]
MSLTSSLSSSAALTLSKPIEFRVGEVVAEKENKKIEMLGGAGNEKVVERAGEDPGETLQDSAQFTTFSSVTWSSEGRGGGSRFRCQLSGIMQFPMIIRQERH